MVSKFPEIENNPEHNKALFNYFLNTNKLKNDAALARKLEVAPPVISKMRKGTLPVGAAMILNLHETFDVSVKFIKDYLKQGHAT